ncbi:MAG TPA: PilW family protein [Gammaproteobacteria bacterium]|nr:PilW family protein [Gammaproteobacteria bacterium]
MKLSPKQNGLSLVEILIGLALSMILLAGVLQVFLNSKQAYRLGAAFSELQENGRFISDYIPRIVRNTGYRSTPLNTNFASLEEIFPEDKPSIQVLDNSGVNGSDILTIRFQGSGDSLGNPDGTMRDCLNQPVDADEIVTNVFSISNLYELDCQSINPNAPSTVASNTLVSGVENLQVLLGEDLDGDDAPDRYVPPNFAGVNLNNVVSMRISILVRSTEEVHKMLDTETYNLLGTLFVPTADYRIRRIFSFTIVLRNMISQV